MQQGVLLAHMHLMKTVSLMTFGSPTAVGCTDTQQYCLRCKHHYNDPCSPTTAATAPAAASCFGRQPFNAIASVHDFSYLHFLPFFLQLTCDVHSRWPCTAAANTAGTGPK